MSHWLSKIKLDLERKEGFIVHQFMEGIMERISIFEKNLRKFAILDNAEGDINTIWQDERTGEFFMESMLEKCSGYVYFKASKENMLKFIEQGITLEELFAQSMDHEVFIRLFRDTRVNRIDLKFHCGGIYRKIGIDESSGKSEYLVKIRKQMELG